MLFFWNGFYVKCVFSVQLSSIAVGISFYEILRCISLQFFLYIFFSTREKQCIYDISSEHVFEEQGQSRAFIHSVSATQFNVFI